MQHCEQTIFRPEWASSSPSQGRLGPGKADQNKKIFRPNGPAFQSHTERKPISLFIPSFQFRERSARWASGRFYQGRFSRGEATLAGRMAGLVGPEYQDFELNQTNRSDDIIPHPTPSSKTHEVASWRRRRSEAKTRI